MTDHHPAFEKLLETRRAEGIPTETRQMTSTIETISDSSNALWDLVCRFEDALDNRAKVEAEAIAMLSKEDLTIFSEELRRVEIKERMALQVVKNKRPCLTYR